VRVDPIKPTLKAPGTIRLKLHYDKLLSTFAFKFYLRRYTKGGRLPMPMRSWEEVGRTHIHIIHALCTPVY
jgi:hypothetical protein